MMKVIVAVAIAAAGGIASYLAPSPLPPGPGIDTMKTASVGDKEQAGRQAYDFAVTNIADNTACLVRRGGAATPRTSTLAPDTACDDVWPRLSEARNWTQGNDGAILVTDAAGNQLLQLSPGDGVAYVAFDPPSAQIMVTAIR